jgi:hypothetical protein
VALAVLVTFVGCSSEADDESASAPIAEPGPEIADPQQSGSPSALSPPAERAEPVPEDETDPVPVGPVGASEQASEDFPRWSGDPIGLVDVRLIALGDLDRLVLEFDGQVPSWQVRDGTGPLIEQPGRSEIQLDGGAHLEIRLVPATSVARDADEPMAAYEGPSHLAAGGEAILEALLIGDSSDILVWGVGVAGTPSFAVGVLEDPARLVVDVLRGAS